MGSQGLAGSRLISQEAAGPVANNRIDANVGNTGSSESAGSVGRVAFVGLTARSLPGQ
jgi:hypothetical protein